MTASVRVHQPYEIQFLHTFLLPMAFWKLPLSPEDGKEVLKADERAVERHLKEEHLKEAHEKEERKAEKFHMVIQRL